MILKANVYENAWVFSEDCPAPPENYPSENKVAVFLDIFLTPKFFRKTVIWKNTSLRNSADYMIPKKGEHHLVITSLEEAKQVRSSLSLSSDYKGHLSVLYVPSDASLFRNEILKHGHYAQGRPITIGNDEGEYQLDRSKGQDVGFFLSDVFCSGEHIFAFSHDAEFLFEILR